MLLRVIRHHYCHDVDAVYCFVGFATITLTYHTHAAAIDAIELLISRYENDDDTDGDAAPLFYQRCCCDIRRLSASAMIISMLPYDITFIIGRYELPC